MKLKYIYRKINLKFILLSLIVKIEFQLLHRVREIIGINILCFLKNANRLNRTHFDIFNVNSCGVFKLIKIRFFIFQHIFLAQHIFDLLFCTDRYIKLFFSQWSEIMHIENPGNSESLQFVCIYQH